MSMSGELFKHQRMKIFKTSALALNIASDGEHLIAYKLFQLILMSNRNLDLTEKL